MEIIKFGDPRFTSLQNEAQRVSFPLDDSSKQCIKTLMDKMTELGDQAAGLAANQIGLPQNIFAVRISNKIRVFINTEMIGCQGKQSNIEGCLSLPEFSTKTKRPRSVTIKFQDEAGNWNTETFEGFSAQVMMHEMEHMQGKLIVQHFNALQNKTAHQTKFGMKLTPHRRKVIAARRAKKKRAAKQRQ